MKKLRRFALYPFVFTAIITLLIAAYLYDGRENMERILDGLVNAW